MDVMKISVSSFVRLACYYFVRAASCSFLFFIIFSMDAYSSIPVIYFLLIIPLMFQSKKEIIVSCLAKTWFWILKCRSSENTKTGIQFSKQLKPKKLEIWEKTRILPKFWFPEEQRINYAKNKINKWKNDQIMVIDIGS